MVAPTITALYAALNAILNIFLASNVSTARRKHKVSIGHGDSPELLLAARIHSNNAEFVPLAIVMLLIAELLGGASVIIHACGGLLLLARVAHAIGMLWFLQGGTNTDYLNAHGVSIWNEWADANGELGPVYGAQWRRWHTVDGRVVDQISELIAGLQHNPDSRRHIVSAWNVGEIPHMALAPCHVLCQFYVAEGELSCQLYQRSADVFLGVPFNIASYALLTLMVAQICKLKVGEFVHTLGDAHLYLNHLEQADLQLSREVYAAPEMRLNPLVSSIFDFKYEDFELRDYRAHPGIAAPIAV